MEKPKPITNVRGMMLAVVLAAGAIQGHLLTEIHRGATSDGNEGRSLCGKSGLFDCTQNLGSHYSVALGLPVSVYATAWFALMLVVLLSGLAGRQEQHALHRTLFRASLPALAASMFYAGVSAFVLKSVCLHCLALHALVAATAVLSFAGMGISRQRVACALATSGRIAGRWLAPVAVFAGVIVWERSSEQLSSPLVPRRNSEAAQLAGLPRRGPEKSVLRLLAFTDFECPACRVAAGVLERFMDRHPEEVELRVVDLPLRRIQQLDAGVPLKLSAYLPAALGVVMHQRGRFWEYYQAISSSERPASPALVWHVAEKILGAREMEAVRRDAESAEVLAALRRHAAIATAHQVEQTPTWFINGERVVGTLTMAALEARLVDAQRQFSSEPRAPVSSQ